MVSGALAGLGETGLTPNGITMKQTGRNLGVFIDVSGSSGGTLAESLTELSAKGRSLGEGQPARQRQER
jgi:hypothetical protein